MTEKNYIVVMTEAGTLKEVPVVLSNLSYINVRQGTLEDYGLFCLNGAKAAFKNFPIRKKSIQVSEISFFSGKTITVLHSEDDIRKAVRDGVTTLYMSPKVKFDIQVAIEETKLYTSMPHVAKGLGTPDAVRHDDANFASIARAAFDIRLSLLNGTPLDGSPVTSVAVTKPTDAITSSYPPTLLNPHP